MKFWRRLVHLVKRWRNPAGCFVSLSCPTRCRLWEEETEIVKKFKFNVTFPLTAQNKSILRCVRVCKRLIKGLEIEYIYVFVIYLKRRNILERIWRVGSKGAIINSTLLSQLVRFEIGGVVDPPKYLSTKISSRK